MAITAGTITQNSVSANSVMLTASPATGGTGPYTYQWYKSTTSNFTPGASNLISGATDLTLDDTGLTGNTITYYKLVALDTGASNAPATYTQQTVTTAAAPSPSLNQFRMSKAVGQPRLLPCGNTVSCQVDASQTGSLLAGQAVKIVDNAGGVPKVVACAANTDNCFGFINLDTKNSAWLAGQAVEVSRGGNYLYLYATGPVSRGQAVTLDISQVGGVAQAVASSGANVVGEAYDKATAAGQIIGVYLKTTSFQYA